MPGSYTRLVNVAVLVPVKAFAQAKQRLSTALDPATRVRLATWMAEQVISAAGEVPVYVVCDDDDVRSWAEQRGAIALWTARLGLNGAVDDGVEAIARAGFDHVIVTHADLPLPHSLIRVAREHTATIVPDHRRDGTNVMSFPTSTPIPASYGPGSFSRHWASAAHLCREVRPDPRLAIDVDTPDDLTNPRLKEVLPSWLPTIPANRFLNR